MFKEGIFDRDDVDREISAVQGEYEISLSNDGRRV
jgi:secreted Zn-dependent insulinase-like peptidase